MSVPHIHRIVSAQLFFIPIETRVPLKFGPETVTSVVCARAALEIADAQGTRATGWGETPLSVQWVWPSHLPFAFRQNVLKEFCVRLASVWMKLEGSGHPLEAGARFQESALKSAWQEVNTAAKPEEQMPWLAALVCNSVFDLALHDAFGNLVGRPVYQTYGPDWLSRDLASYLEPASDSTVSFRGRFPSEFLAPAPVMKLRAWHLVGGLDLLDPSELRGNEPADGEPVVLTDWIERDGLNCLKVKLRGNDGDWDYQRLVRVGQIAISKDVDYLSADFNCTVRNPTYVNEVLDRLRVDYPRTYDRLLYVEQPFPYELEEHRIDVRSVAARKPLFLDESAHDWRLIRLGRELGWSGVALKTCKTQTGAILSACWAKAHGMSLMVQDLTNPMLAQIPHALLAAHVGTIMGIETNAMQFYPAASAAEAKVHPGLYRRHEGSINLSTIRGPGFGYRVSEIERELPEPAVSLRQ